MWWWIVRVQADGSQVYSGWSYDGLSSQGVIWECPGRARHPKGHPGSESLRLCKSWPGPLRTWWGHCTQCLETHTDTLLPKAFIESLVLPRGHVQGSGHSNNPGITFPWLKLLLGEMGGRPLHLAPLRAILLKEGIELGAGFPLAGAPAQALRGHLLDPASRVQQVLGAEGAKGRSAGVGRMGRRERRA